MAGNRHVNPDLRQEVTRTDLRHARVKSANAKQIRNESAKVLRALILYFDGRSNLTDEERKWLLEATIAFHKIVADEDKKDDFVPLDVVLSLDLNEEQLKIVSKATVKK